MNKVVFAINATLGKPGHGLTVNQATVEFKKRGLLEKVYCSAKGRYALADLPLEIISLPNRLPPLLLKIPYLRNRKDTITLISDIIFDRLVSQRINLQTPGFFIGVAGHCLNTIKKLKANSSKKIILYSMNSHINNLYNIWEEEDRRFSRGTRTHLIHKNMVKRVLDEYKYSDYIFVLSKYAYETFIDNNIKKEKLKIINPGVDLSLFYPSQGKNDDTFRVCFCGFLTLRKGFHYLLQAVDELHLPNLELFLLGGSGDPVSHRILKYYKKRVNIKHYIIESGKGFRHSTIFVLPSLEDGWGVVVSEAMACGLPVIVTENTGAKEIVDDGINGFIIPPRDVASIKEKIFLLYSDKKLRDRMSEAALKKRPLLDQDRAAKDFFEECSNL